MPDVPVRTFRLEDEEWQEIKAIAKQKGIPVSQYIRKTLKEKSEKERKYLRQVRGAADSVVGAGIIGVALALWLSVMIVLGI